MKTEENNRKKETPRVNMELIEGIVTLLALLLFGFFCFIPVIFNFQEASVVGRIFMIVGSVHCPFLLTVVIWESEKYNKDNKTSKLSRIGIYVFCLIVFVVASLYYIDDTLWGFKYAIWGLFIICFFFYGLYSFLKENFRKTFNSEATPIFLIVCTIFSFFFAGIVYETDIDTASFFFKLAIGFIYLMVLPLYIFYKFFRKKRKETKEMIISAILSAIFWGSLILITFPFYVRWWGLTGKDFETFVSVYAAVVGGGLTLAGVAWTIQHTNKMRQEDKKNESKPFFSLLSNLSVEVAEANKHVYHFSKQERDDESKSIVGNFINSDKNCFILKRINLRESTYTPNSHHIIIKEKAFQIRIFEDESLDDDCEIILVVEDQNGSEWSYKLVKSGALIVSMSALQGENK